MLLVILSFNQQHHHNVDTFKSAKDEHAMSKKKLNIF
jgi:hypothetical protein